MGYFYSIWFSNSKGEEIEIQFKNVGEGCNQSFVIGDYINTWDGIHFGFEGCFVVYGGKIVAAFDVYEQILFTKWGQTIPYPDLSDINPITNAVKKMISEQNLERSVATGDDSKENDGKQNV